MADSKVGVNTVEKDGVIYKEMPGQPGVPNIKAPVDMDSYNRLGGFGSPYNNNPAFKTVNTFPSAPSGAGGHDIFVDKMQFGTGMTAATAPPYLLINMCAAAPALCGIYVNTRTDKDFLQSSNYKQGQ